MSERNQELQILLDRAGVIKERYQQVNMDNEFNIFSILRKEHDEVGLHSRFICELLNPKGVHYQEDKFLKMFLDHIGMEYDENDLKNYKVEREYRIIRSKDNDQYNNLDILISYGDKAYIIENKIYAEERKDQLLIYYENIKEKFISKKVILLTLFDHELSEKDEKELEEKLEGNFIHITYREQIRDWIAECIKETAQKPLLREALVMYKNLVLKLTGQSYSEGMVREMKDLIIKDRGNFENAVEIAESLSEARIEIHKRFWDDLEDLLKNGYRFEAENLDKEYEASDKTIRTYDQSSNKEVGLHYLLKDEEDYKIVFWVGVSKNRGLEYSICLFDDSNNYIGSREIMPKIWDRVKSIVLNQLESYEGIATCPASKIVKDNLNFTFKDNNYELEFILDDSRKDFIKEIAEETYKEINYLKEAFK